MGSRKLCTSCKNVASPMYDTVKEVIVGKYFTCRSCAEARKTEYWDTPFFYPELMEKNNLVWLDQHPDYPIAFLDTDINRLTDNLKAASAWTPTDKKSLLLHGTTGAGKTRTAWIVFNRLWLADFPDRAVWLSMRKLEMAIEKGFEEHKHGQALDFLCTVPVLCFDDLGKERFTQRMETDLFAIIDERTSNNRTTIITTNYNSKTLYDRFNNKETAEAFIRRLRDYFTAIHA